MRSQIDRKCQPTQSEYYLQVHQQPILLQCQTHISQAPPSETNNQDEPYIQNFYCYTINSQLYKVTKIRIGQQLVTMIDRMSFNPQMGQNQLKKKSRKTPPTQQLSIDLETSVKKVRLSVVAKSALRLLEEWVKQHEPDLMFILKEIKEKSMNQRELKQNLSLNSEIREAFIKFQDHFSSRRYKKTLHRTLENWAKVIIPVHDDYLQKEEFLNSVLDGSQEYK